MKKIKKVLEAVCIGSLFLAVMGCENADGSLNTAWVVPMLSVSCITGFGLKRMEGKNNG